MVELPELNDDQRLFLKTIFDYFHKEGKWPTFLWVENTIHRTYPARWSHFDMVKVCKSLPDGFASVFGLHRNYEQEAGFIAPVLYYFPEAKEEMADFIRVVRFCVSKINASDELRPEISSEDLRSQLHMQPLAIRKMFLLLQWEPNIFNGSGANEEWWQVYLKRGTDGVRCFEGVETFEQYLEKRTELTRIFSGNVAVQQVQIEPGNVLPALISRKVFIVHGHDTEARETVAHFIQKLGLQPIILDEQPSEGKTIIEKFETHSDVRFAVVLLTPDDLGTSKDKLQDLKARARQNVILELGYFLAKLGRKGVCCLSKGGIEIPSDYHGVVYIPMDVGEWRFQLAKEIKQVITDIDMNKLGKVPRKKAHVLTREEAVEFLANGNNTYPVSKAKTICKVLGVKFSDDLIISWKNAHEAMRKYTIKAPDDKFHEAVLSLELSNFIMRMLGLSVEGSLPRGSRTRENAKAIAEKLGIENRLQTSKREAITEFN